MDAAYTVRFKGFSAKHVEALEMMIRKDVAEYLVRMNMESATVEKATVLAAVKGGKKNAKPR